MNRGRQRTTPIGAVDDADRSAGVTLPSMVPDSSGAGPGEGTEGFRFWYKDDDNWVKFDLLSNPVNIEVCYKGHVMKPRKTCVQVNGVQSEVYVFRELVDGEVEEGA